MDHQEYRTFLDRKNVAHAPTGFHVPLAQLNSKLFDWQKPVAQWALETGKSALFLECGLGKTPIGLEIANQVASHTGRPVLWLSPLAVAHQTVKEAAKFGQVVKYVRSQEEAQRADVPILIANYEMLKHFKPGNYSGVVPDESSILKAFMGKMKRDLIREFNQTLYKFPMTATPAPNDHLELGNHSQFLDAMDSNAMISRFFVNDSMKAGGYRLRGHGEAKFWRWVATWAVCMSKPSDIGYSDEGYVLPEPELIEVPVGVDHSRAHEAGQLFLDTTLSSTGMWKDKRATVTDRVRAAINVVQSDPAESWVVWCDTNEEADLLKAGLPEAVEVRGSHTPTIKENRLMAFSDGTARIIITKADIAAFGLNWQHCARHCFVGLTYSFEKFYQAFRRSYRFGNPRPVKAYLIVAETEQGIKQVLMNKWAAHTEMQSQMAKAMSEVGLGKHARQTLTATENAIIEGDSYTLHLGDCVTTLAHIESDSVDHSTFSPPFKELYIYSDKEADMGNAGSSDEFLQHYRYFARELVRVMKDGASVMIHCKDLPMYQNREGWMGLQDFPGELIQAHEEAGFQLAGWVTIWKDPKIEMERTNNAGLLWSEAFCKRAERCRQGMADYGLVFVKGTVPESATVPTRIPRAVVQRCVDLWSNGSDDVLTPYHGKRKATPSASRAGLIVLDWDDTMPLPKVTKRLMDGRILAYRVAQPRDMPRLITRCKEFNLIFHSRVALTDGTWLVVFRKWVETMPTESHVTHDINPRNHQYIGNNPPRYWVNDRDYSIQIWRNYASPVWDDLNGLPSTHPDIWMDIKQTNVLNGKIAREDSDEKHICPLQLDFIERTYHRYTQPGDLILSPFAGVGSEGVTAIKLSRRFVGIELKRSYWELAGKHLQEAEFLSRQPMLF